MVNEQPNSSEENKGPELCPLSSEYLTKAKCAVLCVCSRNGNGNFLSRKGGVGGVPIIKEESGTLWDLRRGG